MEWCLRTFRTTTLVQRFVDRAGHRARQRRRHGVPDLPRAVPLGPMEAHPVRIAMQASHLSHRDTARVNRVDRPRRRMTYAFATGAGTQSVGHAARWQFMERS